MSGAIARPTPLGAGTRAPNRLPFQEGAQSRPYYAQGGTVFPRSSSEVLQGAAQPTFVPMGQLQRWDFAQGVQQGGLTLSSLTPQQLAQFQAEERARWIQQEHARLQQERARDERQAQLAQQLERERAEFPDTRRGYRRPPGELPRTQPAIGESCIRHRRVIPFQDLHTINRLLDRVAGGCRQSSCECCAQVFGPGTTSFCGCSATRASQMFCRSCWDVHNADQVTAEMKIKAVTVHVAAKWPQDPKDARTVSKQFAEKKDGYARRQRASAEDPQSKEGVCNSVRVRQQQARGDCETSRV
jgi:hypothetical protein